MGRKRKSTRRIRVQLDFVIELGAETDCVRAPFGGDAYFTEHVIEGAAQPILDMIKDEFAIEDENDAEGAKPHGTMKLSLDFRPV